MRPEIGHKTTYKYAKSIIRLAQIRNLNQLTSFEYVGKTQKILYLSQLSKCRNNLWSHPVESNPTTDGPLTEQLFRNIYCAELLRQRPAFDPLRLRVARVLSYGFHDRLLTDMCMSLATSNRRPRGRSAASIATEYSF